MTETLQRVQPRLMVCGHIHAGYGATASASTEVINASLVDDHYRPVNSAVEVVL